VWCVNPMTIDQLLERIQTAPETIEFSDVIAVIDACYEFTPVSFQNGELLNQAGENSGSCRLFAFADLHKLSQQQTLDCFGRYYREDVLLYPGLDNHQNIRQFMRTGWFGIDFKSCPLRQK
jgi:hypothetical protein